jgi:cell pole-organizing protein PopZ
MSVFNKDKDSVENVLSSIREVMSGKITKDIPPGNTRNTNEKKPLILTTSIQEDGTIKDLRNKEAAMTKKIQNQSEAEVDPAWDSVATGTDAESIQAKSSSDMMISPQAIAESVAAISELTSPIPQDDTLKLQKFQPQGGRTVEELAHEILKPLLKDWLDSHLPSLVKWIVTEQIEKIMQQKQKAG